jgi:salicylate hydroxylase
VIYYGIDEGASINLLAVYRPNRLPGWTEESNRKATSTGEALKTFDGYGWDQRILDLVLNAEGDTSFWALVDLPRLPRWTRGRVILLGDAAHAPLPHQGQGAGMAIEDAYALGELLGCAGLENFAAAFQAFEKLRSERVRRVQLYSQLSGHAIKFDGKAAAHRDETWPALPDHISWIHTYRLEELIDGRQRPLTAVPE